jgi:hypothetical protein
MNYQLAELEAKYNGAIRNFIDLKDMWIKIEKDIANKYNSVLTVPGNLNQKNLKKVQLQNEENHKHLLEAIRRVFILYF